MAKLPTYERQATLMAGVDTIQAPNVQEAMRRSQSIQGGLDVISKFATSQAERAVKKEAAQYTVANPLTSVQLEQARVSGVNPIEAALNGGMVWNDAVRKLYADQASAELTNTAYKHYENVYDRVQKGELTDSAIIQQELETPLKSWANVIAQIDPESANSFYQRRITDGNSYYKASLTHLRTAEQDRQDKISRETFSGMLKQFDMDVKNQEPSVLFQKFIQGKEEAKKLFVNSKHKTTFENEIDKEFTTALFRQISKGLQTSGEYGSSEEILTAMSEGKLGKYSEIWNELEPTQKELLEAYVKSDFATLDTNNRKAYVSIENQAKDIVAQIVSNIDVDSPGFTTAYNQFITRDTEVSGSLNAAAKAQIERVKSYVKISKQYKGQSIDYIERDIANKRAAGMPESTMQEYDYFAKKLKEQRDADPAGFILRRSNSRVQDVDILMSPDKVAIKGAFDEQISSLHAARNDFVPGVTPILTKAQESRLTQLIKSPATTHDMKVLLASNIVDQFGADAIDVFKQVAPKDPVFAHIGALAADGVDSNTLADVLEGKQFLDESGLDITPKRKKLKSSVELVDALRNHPGESETVLKAADAWFAKHYPDKVRNNNINDNDYKEAIQAVTGAEGEFGGYTTINDKMVIIQKDMKRDEFNKYFTTAAASDFLSAIVIDTGEVASITAPNGKEHITEDLANATPQRVGDYYILLDKNGHPFLDQSYMPITFDASVLRDIYNAKQMPGVGSLQQEIPNAGKIRKRTGFSSWSYERMGGPE